MKPRGKKSRNCGPLSEESKVKIGKTSPKKTRISKALCGEGIQCEMGSEIFRRYWTPSNEGINNDLDQVITGDPIGFVVEEDNIRSASDREENPTIESNEKVDSNWPNALSSHGIAVEEKSGEATATCEEASGIMLTDNGGGAMVFPVILNVVDGSGSKEVVAVVSLDAMSPGDNSNNLKEEEETLPKSTEENIVEPEVKPTKTYTCGDCGQVLSSIVLFEQHSLQHDRAEPFKCTRCTRRFKRRQDLDRHKICHPEESFPCGTCFMKFADREELVSHYKTHDPVPDPLERCAEPEEPEILCKVETFQCSQCDKTFNDADLLQHHEFTHVEGELFPCDECGKTFREESRLGMHLKLHKKNQKCDKCDEIFTNMFDFNEHMITHKYEDSKDDYKCVHCRVRFNSFYFLKKHATSHGMEVHWCGDCGGSGHVGSPHGEHDSGEPNSAGEKPVLLMVKNDTLSKQEEDPLKLEDSPSDGRIASAKEQLEIEVQVDEVVIKAEKNSFSEDEAQVTEIVNTKEKKENGKRKYSGRTIETIPEVCLQPRRKSKRNN